MTERRDPAISPEDLARAVARAADRHLQLGVRLPDGRWLAYAEFGAPDGRPVFVFHGVPGSRLLMDDDRPIADAGLRMIAVDRPGIGRSDPQRGRRMLDWPRDIAVLAGPRVQTIFVRCGSGFNGGLLRRRPSWTTVDGVAGGWFGRTNPLLPVVVEYKRKPQQ